MNNASRSGTTARPIDVIAMRRSAPEKPSFDATKTDGTMREDSGHLACHTSGGEVEFFAPLNEPQQ